ncbi:MAG: nucleotide exchange factor GrpE [Flavobacterium sp.]|nr:nucleotide exchange factor GrpE [Flavobacterium sp.]
MKLKSFINRLPNFPLFTRGKKIEHYQQQSKIMEEKDLNTQNDTVNDTFNINADENAAGYTHLNEPVEEENQLQKLQDEINEQKDKYLRLMAEFDNFRRRTAKERLETIQTAGKDVVVSLLDVLDDCDRAEKQLQTSDNIELQKEGVQLVFNKIRSTLQLKGVKVMESINTEFDVEKHEAITEIPAPTPELKGKIIDEVMKGYYLNDKIIRFAKVVVGK